MYPRIKNAGIGVEILIEWLQSQRLTVLVDPTEDMELGDDGQVVGPVFMPDVGRFDAHTLATQTDFIICLGGDGEDFDRGGVALKNNPIFVYFFLRSCVACLSFGLICVFISFAGFMYILVFLGRGGHCFLLSASL